MPSEGCIREPSLELEPGTRGDSNAPKASPQQSRISLVPLFGSNVKRPTVSTCGRNPAVTQIPRESLPWMKQGAQPVQTSSLSELSETCPSAPTDRTARRLTEPSQRAAPPLPGGRRPMTERTRTATPWVLRSARNPRTPRTPGHASRRAGEIPSGFIEDDDGKGGGKESFADFGVVIPDKLGGGEYAWKSVDVASSGPERCVTALMYSAVKMMLSDMVSWVSVLQGWSMVPLGGMAVESLRKRHLRLFFEWWDIFVEFFLALLGSDEAVFLPLMKKRVGKMPAEFSNEQRQIRLALFMQFVNGMDNLRYKKSGPVDGAKLRFLRTTVKTFGRIIMEYVESKHRCFKDALEMMGETNSKELESAVIKKLLEEVHGPQLLAVLVRPIRGTGWIQERVTLWRRVTVSQGMKLANTKVLQAVRQARTELLECSACDGAVPKGMDETEACLAF